MTSTAMPAQHEAVQRIGIIADGEAAEGRADTGHGRAEHDQRCLGEDEAEAPGGDDGVERAVIEMADDQYFHQRAHGGGDQRADEDGERQRHAGMGGGDGDIGAAHDEFAMRQIDHAHHAEDDGEAAGGQNQKGEGVAER